MTAGPIAPDSVYLGGAAGNLFPNFYTCATNTNSSGIVEGIGVAASLAADAMAILTYQMPPTIPSGTLKLLLRAQANATSGVAKVTVKDATVAAAASPGTVTLSSETQVSQTWATADIFVDNTVTLTASPSAKDTLLVTITFNTSGWTLAQVSTWRAFIIWE